MSDAIKLTAILSHEDIRDAVKNNKLPELICETTNQIRADMAVAVQRWLAEQANPKATRLKGGTDQ